MNTVNALERPVSYKRLLLWCEHLSLIKVSFLIDVSPPPLWTCYFRRIDIKL